MKTKVIAYFFIFWVITIIFALAFWMERKFGIPNFSQVLYHLQFGFEGLDGADAHLYESLFKNILNSAFVALLIILVEFRILKKRKFSVLKFYVAAPMAILGVIFFLSKVSFWSYVFDNSSGTFFEEHYSTPKIVVEPKDKKNLVLIYVESFENTYANKAIFDRNYLEKIQNKFSDSFSFANFHQAYGTGWTMGGIVSSQCGLPLIPFTLSEKNFFTEKIKSFLPHATCLGDILQKAGYKNVFMGGAKLAFAGKDKFLSQHGYSEMYGLKHWQKNSETNLDFWGLHDDVLFTRALEKLDELEKAKRPFNLTLLTVDTHFPHGFISETCAVKGVKEILGIVDCTAEMIVGFINQMKAKGYLKKTNVVVMGDHLTMKNTVYSKILKEPNRTIFNLFITSEKFKKNREKIYHFDIYPTILYTLGFHFQDERVALGVSAIGKGNNDVELYNVVNLDHKLASHSNLYQEFWRK